MKSTVALVMLLTVSACNRTEMRSILIAVECVVLAACGSVVRSRFTLVAAGGDFLQRPTLSIEIPREFSLDPQQPSEERTDIVVHRWSRMSQQSLELRYCAWCPPKREGGPIVVNTIDEEAIEVDGLPVTLRHDEIVDVNGRSKRILQVYVFFGISNFGVEAEGLSKEEFRRILQTIRISGVKKPNKSPEPTSCTVMPRATE